MTKLKRVLAILFIILLLITYIPTQSDAASAVYFLGAGIATFSFAQAFGLPQSFEDDIIAIFNDLSEDFLNAYGIVKATYQGVVQYSLATFKGHIAFFSAKGLQIRDYVLARLREKFSEIIDVPVPEYSLPSNAIQIENCFPVGTFSEDYSNQQVLQFMESGKEFGAKVTDQSGVSETVFFKINYGLKERDVSKISYELFAFRTLVNSGYYENINTYKTSKNVKFFVSFSTYTSYNGTYLYLSLYVYDYLNNTLAHGNTFDLGKTSLSGDLNVKTLSFESLQDQSKKIFLNDRLGFDYSTISNYVTGHDGWYVLPQSTFLENVPSIRYLNPSERNETYQPEPVIHVAHDGSVIVKEAPNGKRLGAWFPDVPKDGVPLPSYFPDVYPGVQKPFDPPREDNPAIPRVPAYPLPDVNVPGIPLNPDVPIDEPGIPKVPDIPKNPDIPKDPDIPGNPDIPKEGEKAIPWENVNTKDKAKEEAKEDAKSIFNSIKVDFKKRDWSTKFPFCIPFDITRLFTSLVVPQKKPNFNINLDTKYFRISQKFDLDFLEPYIRFGKFLFLVIFSLKLMVFTRQVIKW